jgi:peptidyl-prolyl cis-trans isomerase D
MMQAFRNAAKPVVVVLMVAFVGWLVFDLSGLSGGGGFMTQTSVGKVEGRAIDSRVYQEAVQATITNQQQASGDVIGIEGVAAIRDQVWEQFVTSTLLEREFRRRGIRVNSAEIADAIRSFPPTELREDPSMMTDGQFDVAKYQRWLASAVGQQYIPLLENRYREEILRSRLFRAIVADVAVSDAALWERFRDEHEQVQVGLVMLDPATSVPESGVQVSPAEVESWYRDHRESFRQPRRAWLSYVAIPRVPLASDTAAARDRALAIREEIVNGAPFAEVASRESADQVSAAQGGDLGEWTRGQFDPDFQAVADRLPLNTVSEPVLSSFGFHVIEVTLREGDRFQGRHVLVPVEVTGDHREELDARADSLEALGADRLDGAALDTVARALGITIRETGQLVENQRVLAAEEVVPDAGVWAFQAESGETSPVIETDRAYYLFRVDSLGEEGIPPLARIRSEVEEAARQAKRVAEVTRMANEIRQEAISGNLTLSEVAARHNLEYSEPGAFSRLAPLVQSPELSGAAFGLAPGEISAPVSAVGGVWLLQGLSRTEADADRFATELPSLRARELQTMRQLRIQEYLASLRAAAKITDRRSELYRTDAQLEALGTAPILF